MNTCVVFATALLMCSVHISFSLPTGQSSSESTDTSEERQKRSVSDESDTSESVEERVARDVGDASAYQESPESADASEERQKRAVLDESDDVAKWTEDRMARDVGEEANQYQDISAERAQSDVDFNFLQELMRPLEMAQLRNARQLDSGSDGNDDDDDDDDDDETYYPDYENTSDYTDESYDESEYDSNARHMDKRNFAYKCDRRRCRQSCKDMNFEKGGNCASNGRCYCNRAKGR